MRYMNYTGSTVYVEKVSDNLLFAGYKALSSLTTPETAYIIKYNEIVVTFAVVELASTAISLWISSSWESLHYPHHPI